MLRSTRLLVTSLFAATLSLGLSACKSQDTSKSGDMSSAAAMMQGKPDIIETATGPGMEQVTTLVQAVQAAGLVETLKGPGPFTVFAPTNAAFAKLPPGTLDDLLKPENKDKLKAILLYHVHVGDAIMAKDAHTMELSTANGKPLHVMVNGDSVMVDGANVVKANIVCSNGIIHWIDAVLMP
jgi:transforming growth factor-beta-induced protein